MLVFLIITEVAQLSVNHVRIVYHAICNKYVARLM